MQKFKLSIFLSITKPGVYYLKLYIIFTLESNDISAATLGHKIKFYFPILNFIFSSNNANVVDAKGESSSKDFIIENIVIVINELKLKSL